MIGGIVMGGIDGGIVTGGIDGGIVIGGIDGGMVTGGIDGGIVMGDGTGKLTGGNCMLKDRRDRLERATLLELMEGMSIGMPPGNSPERISSIDRRVAQSENIGF